jgi:2-methylcitrate dehydratase PrpD
VDSREFSKVEEKVQDMERKIKMFDTNPEMAANYDAKNPMNRMIVDFYNGQVNNELKELRGKGLELFPNA